MDIKISKDKCKFYVNEKKRRVVCVLPINKYMISMYLDDIMPDHLYLNGIPKLNDRFIGVAKCHEEDTWDEEVGKLIAYGKAKAAFCRAFFNAINNYFNTIDKELDTLIDSCNMIGEHWRLNLISLRQQINDKLGIDPPPAWENAN